MSDSPITIFHGYKIDPDVGKRMPFIVTDTYDVDLVDVFKQVYWYFGNPDLNDVFRQNNTVDGTEQNVQQNMRSLSVGDAIATLTGVHIVMPFGFHTLDETELKDFMEKAE